MPLFKLSRSDHNILERHHNEFLGSLYQKGIELRRSRSQKSSVTMPIYIWMLTSSESEGKWCHCELWTKNRHCVDALIIGHVQVV